MKTSFEDSVVFVVWIYIGLVSLGVLWLLVVLYHFTVFVMDFSSFASSVVPVLLLLMVCLLLAFLLLDHIMVR